MKAKTSLGGLLCPRRERHAAWLLPLQEQSLGGNQFPSPKLFDHLADFADELRKL